MGSTIELNDTLQITAEQGFPVDILNLERHRRGETKSADWEEKIFEFKNKPGARIFHTPPTRVFLVQNIGGKWLYWGKVIILEQTIALGADGEMSTSGKFKITEIYDLEYQKLATQRETRPGESYL